MLGPLLLDLLYKPLRLCLVFTNSWRVCISVCRVGLWHVRKSRNTSVREGLPNLEDTSSGGKSPTFDERQCRGGSKQFGSLMFGGIRSLGSTPVLLIGAGACRGRSQSGVALAPSEGRALGRALDGDLCSARECPARGGRPGQFSRARSPWVRCCGNCLAAGAGVLTWWRRRAQRAPARQGAACRPPRSRRGAPRSSPGSGKFPSARAPFTVVSRSRPRTRSGPDSLARRRCALEAVEKVVTARRALICHIRTLCRDGVLQDQRVARDDRHHNPDWPAFPPCSRS